MVSTPIARGLLFALAAAVLATAITLKHRASQRSLANAEVPASVAEFRCRQQGFGQVHEPECNQVWRKSQERILRVKRIARR